MICRLGETSIAASCAQGVSENQPAWATPDRGENGDRNAFIAKAQSRRGAK
jgi:hypothetical protein